MRIFDCFPFFNELDLLELRLNELSDVVDVFVIVEARQTFTGDPKPLHFDENKTRFAKFLPKIRHLVLDSFPDHLGSWGREEYQRNTLREKLHDTKAEDVILFSDLDEIPRASVVQQIAQQGIKRGEVYCLSLSWSYFYLNVQMKERWERLGPRMIRAGDLTELQALRRVLGPISAPLRDLVRQVKSSRGMRRWVRRILVPDAGWHFTWMGGIDAIAVKGSAAPRHSNLPEGPKSTDWAKERLQSLLKNDAEYDLVQIDDSFPRYLRENKERFEQYILD